MSDTGRPDSGKNIYKHGRLKTRKEMDEDRMNDINTLLHSKAKEIALEMNSRKLSGWRNTMLDAAEQISQLQTEIERLRDIAKKYVNTRNDFDKRVDTTKSFSGDVVYDAELQRLSNKMMGLANQFTAEALQQKKGRGDE